jgi:hypothetical protein
LARYKPAHAAARRPPPGSAPNLSGADDSAFGSIPVGDDPASGTADPAPTPVQGVPRVSGTADWPPMPSPTPTGPTTRRRRGRRWLGVSLVVALVAAGGTVAALRLRHDAPASKKAPAESEQGASNSGKVVGGTLGRTGMTSPFTKNENGKPGSTGWRLTAPADKSQIEGYADHTSVAVGEAVTLYVSTVAPSFHVEAYRMGYYQGQGGRLIWQSPDQAGEHQAKPQVKFGINMVEARWRPSLTVPTQGWPEGDYLFKLVAATGPQQYVPLTVRNDSSSAAYVVVNAVTTWQAYNVWGGYDLYQGQVGNSSDFDHRARIVSFDRPYTLGSGAGDFLGLEYPFLSLVESLGLDVTYITDVDLHEHPELLLHHRAVFTMGHDEYYSMAMRNGLESARDHGVNLAFLGANAVYRHIRFAPSDLGADRHEIDYKSAREDPLYGRDNADVTVDWRDPPNNNPESTLIGDFYQCNPVQADMVIVDASSWLFAGSGAHDGQRLANVVGSEYDRYDRSVPGPRNIEILSHSPLYCRGKLDYSDATYYSAPSGAGVFASGTIDWVGNIDAGCPTPNCPGRVLGRVTENLLAAFGAGPAGLTHPSVPDSTALKGGTGATAPYLGGTSGQPSGRGPVSGTAPIYRPPVTTRRTIPVIRRPVPTVPHS